MKVIGKIKYLFRLLFEIIQINRHISNLIDSSGIESNLPYVKLIDGKIFYSFYPTKSQKIIYFLFNKKIKRKVRKECINVLFDLLNRYFPPFDNKFLSNGKFYNINEGKVIIEAGAYIGYFVLKASELVGDTGKVIAFEALEDNYKILKRNIAANNRNNVICINKAVWKNKGSLDFYVNNRQDNSAYSRGKDSEIKINVPCDTIDNMVKEHNLRRVDFIRMTINGAEFDALSGISNILKFKPILLIPLLYIENKKIINKITEFGYDYTIRKSCMLAYKKERLSKFNKEDLN